MIGILGGLIGSLLTVVVTKIIDLIQKKNEYKYDLKRQFFSKKLEAAETAIIRYSLFSEALNQLIILFSAYKEDESEFNVELSNNLLEQFNEKIKLANNSSLALSNSILLYFDLTSNYTANQVLKDTYDNLNMLGVYLENVDAAHDQYLNSIGTELETGAKTIYDNAIKKMEEEMKNIAEFYKEFNIEIEKQISQIRQEMKKYE